jgi:cation transport protein ChaC
MPGLWVFGYGSLIWQPGFDFDEKLVAVLHGYRRAFCMTSVVYRGTPEAPGLVLALDEEPGAHCVGVAYHVPAAQALETHEQYRGGLTLEAQAEVIAHARGPRGPNAEYLLNTVASLEALGLHDPDLVQLAELVRGRLASQAP